MATQDKNMNPSSGDLSAQAMALAEHLGRMAGTLEGTAEKWLNDPSITEQLTRVRDGAAELLNSLGAGALRGRQEATRSGAQGVSGNSGGTPSGRRSAARRDAAHAAGKRHRKPAPSVRGAKKSDETISKARTAVAVRRRRKFG